MIDHSIAASNAAQSAFYASVAARNSGDPRPDALPEWEDYSLADQLDHIEACDMCGFCEAGRSWGECSTCGADTEALPPIGESRCCGSPVALGGPEENDLREWRAA